MPTSSDVRNALDGHPSDVRLTQRAIDAASEIRAFHWPLAFPQVLAKGGFDVVLGNPPWERVEMQEQEFFAFRAPEIAEAKNSAHRKAMIRELSVTAPALAEQYEIAKRSPQAEVLFMKESGRFPFGSAGKVNTYALFADLFRQLVNPNGAAALVLPSGLVNGFTYRNFLRYLLESKTIASFYGFENEDLLFPDITNKTKFGVLTLVGAHRPVDRPWFTAHVRRPEDVFDPARRYSLTAEQIEAVHPNTLNLPAFRWAADSAVTAAIHEAAPILRRQSEAGGVESPWGIAFRQLFNMATDSNLFLDHADVVPRITRRVGALAVLDDGTCVCPLYEGKMLWHFDSRYGTYEGQTEKQANKGVLPHVTNAEHNDPAYRIEPRYWVTQAATETAFDEYSKQWVFAFRDVGPAERTLVGTIVPRTAAGHTASMMTSTCDARSVGALVAILSSLVADYDARQSSNRMSYFVVEQLAVPTPEALAAHPPWLSSRVVDWLADRVLELSYTTEELTAFARDLGFEHPPFRWEPGRRAILQAEIDALTLHLYALSRVQAEWLIDSFAVLQKYEQSDLNEFRTKRLVLEAYDAMADARAGGTVFATKLEPPPAHPSLCHSIGAANFDS